ncbi:unnamed protein product [Paramecium sonneborni]|uniref:Uncharacterized protein n=1 Tax=Paramecium sonneborni TaxID=65129 RepID=A0A8S1QXH1_9CILI|nr:unnamed protein product [Paramecium sonneborni]
MWKEKQIEEYFNSGAYSSKVNRDLDYMRQSYQEDVDNNGILIDKEGFCKQSYKGRSGDDLGNVEIRGQKYQRPMSALISPSYGYSFRQRPITAPGLKVQVKHMMRIDENAAMISVPYHSETKYWRNTKKFDKTNQNVIRNDSTLKKESLVGESENLNIEEEEETKNQNMIDKQIVKNRSFQPIQSQERNQINDRDIEQMTEGAQIKGRSMPQQKGFKHSSLQIYDNLTDIMKLINGQTYTKSPVIVKTKPQGLRPQSAINKQQKVSQRYRPIGGKVSLIAVRGFQL